MLTLTRFMIPNVILFVSSVLLISFKGQRFISSIKLNRIPRLNNFLTFPLLFFKIKIRIRCKNRVYESVERKDWMENGENCKVVKSVEK